MGNKSHPVQYKLRLSEVMHQWLKAQAKENHRTLLAEINMHLEHAKERIEKQSGTKKADDTVESKPSASTKI